MQQIMEAQGGLRGIICTSLTISPEWITALAAIAALIVAIIIAWRQISIQREQTEIARRQTEIARQQLRILSYQEQERQMEKNKAELRPEFIELFMPKWIFRYSLRIKNEGKAQARDIAILINGNPAHEYFAFLKSLKEEDVPRTLDQGVQWEHDMAFAQGQEPKFEIRICWSDDSGEPRSLERAMLPVKEIPISNDRSMV